MEKETKQEIAASNDSGEIVIYQTDDGITQIDVKFSDETVWLTQQQMAALYQTSRTNIVEHIKHIYEEGELEQASTCRNFRQVQMEGNREIARTIPFYNLDMIISLGYRVKSKTATNFRRWTTARLKEYMIKGFALDDERLKGNGGGNYWHELLQRIRDIRSSEKVVYKDETIWATQVAMGELFGVESKTIGFHLQNIFKEGELQQVRTTQKIGVVQMEGTRKVNRDPMFYNLDAIISVGLALPNYRWSDKAQCSAPR